MTCCVLQRFYAAALLNLLSNSYQICGSLTPIVCLQDDCATSADAMISAFPPVFSFLPIPAIGVSGHSLRRTGTTTLARPRDRRLNRLPESNPKCHFTTHRNDTHSTARVTKTYRISNINSWAGTTNTIPFIEFDPGHRCSLYSHKSDWRNIAVTPI